MPGTLLEVDGVCKAFGATEALVEVSFVVRRGEIHALLGENGAGKSTLVKIMSGNIAPDKGKMILSGVHRVFANPRQAMDSGIQVVHQELSVLDNLRVFENVSLGRTPTVRLGLGVVDRRAARNLAIEGLRRIGSSIDPDRYVGELSQAEKQIVEIARALAAQATLLLLDEPTSSLPPDERAKLYELMRAIKRTGVAIVLISHNLEEAIEHADRLTVLRDGKVISSTGTDIGINRIVENMTGRKPGQTFPPRVDPAGGTPRLLATEVLIEGSDRAVSFAVNKGEIVGFAGLVGSGRSQILQSIFGMRRVLSGDLAVDGVAYRPSVPRAAIKAGIGYVTGDRQSDGLFHPLSVRQNLVIARQYRRPADKALVSNGIINHQAARRLARGLIDKVRVKTLSSESLITTLSGGNQQKVILGRWLANEPILLLADEPTRGVSVGSKVDIYQLLRDLARQGVSILVSSSEFEELVGLCDRIYLVANGGIVESIGTTGLTADGLLERVLTAAGTRIREAGAEDERGKNVD